MNHSARTVRNSIFKFSAKSFTHRTRSKSSIITNMSTPVKVNEDAVPIVLYGRAERMADGVARLVAPEYDVVHTCTSLEDALKEIPALLSGDTEIRPANRIGSNMHRPAGANVTPRVCYCGGGIPPEESDQLKKAFNDFPKDGSSKNEVKFMTSWEHRPHLATQGPPKPEVAADLLKKRFKEEGI